MEVIRRSFALNDTFKLGLDDNMMYAIASCHDWGKYEDHATHHLIAARNFMNDEGMKNFFNDEERQIIKEAIEDHRSSKEDEPRSVYGKLISSADTFDIDGLDMVISHLSEYSLPLDFSRKFDKIQKSIEKVDFKELRVLLSEWSNK